MKPFLLGIPFENGIRMMQRLGRGITGAADTPEALFGKLGNFKIEKKLLDLDSFQIRTTPETCNNPEAVRRDNALTLETHKVITQEMETICRQGHFPISIGGDHSITYPLVRGLCRAFPEKRFGLIYLDAHLDLRPLESHAGVSGLISSGNAFRRIIEDKDIRIDGRHMAVIGVHDSGSSLFMAMEQFALDNGMTVIKDSECTLDNLPAIIRGAVRTAGEGTDGIYLSLDIDTVNAGDAPGVSARAEEGLSREVWLKLIGGITEDSHLAGVDLVEASSREKSWIEIIKDRSTPISCPDSFSRTLDLLKETLDTILLARS
jgi:arginase family enzyme